MRRSLFLISVGILVSSPALAGDISDRHRARIEQSIEAQRRAAAKAVADVLGEPVNVRDQACLDGLMGVQFSSYVNDPTDVLQNAMDEAVDQLVNQACSAASDAWNNGVKSLEGSYELPYGLGSIGVEATTGEEFDLEGDNIDPAETQAWVGAINPEAGVDTSVPDSAGASFTIKAPELKKPNKKVNELGGTPTGENPLDVMFY